MSVVCLDCGTVNADDATWCVKPGCDAYLPHRGRAANQPGPPAVTESSEGAAHTQGRAAVLVTMSSALLKVEAGQRVSCEVSITNRGTIVDEYGAVIRGAAGWVSIKPDRLGLFPGETQTSTITFAPPRNGAVPAGAVTFEVLVRSRADPATSGTARGSVEVGAFVELVPELVPPTSRGRWGGRHSVRLLNRGNAPAHVQLNGRDPEQQLRFRFSPLFREDGEGSATTATLRVGPRKRVWWRKPEQTHRFQVFVLTGSDTPAKVEGRFVQQPLIPRWLALATAILLVVTGVAAVLASHPEILSRGTGILPGHRPPEAASTPVLPPVVGALLPGPTSSPAANGTSPAPPGVSPTPGPSSSVSGGAAGAASDASAGAGTPAGGSTSAASSSTAAGPTPTPSDTSRPPPSWSGLPPMTAARELLTATTLVDGRVLVAGGYSQSGALDSAEIYDPVTGNWSAAARMLAARAGHTATRLQNGEVLVVGGWGANFARLNSAELYNPASNSWRSAGALFAARSDQLAVLLPNGRVLVSGGRDDPSNVLLSTEVYNPALNIWTAGASMSVARGGATVSSLSDGRLLVAGGDDGTGHALSSAEIYDPASDRWTAGASMSVPRESHTATTLPDGTILVAGGGSTASAELYSPTANSWTSLSGFTTNRREHVAVLLRSGHVLLAGGADGNTVVASSDQYDPATRQWARGPDMSGPRWVHAAALLTDGRFLVTGGARQIGKGTPPTDSVEVFG
jgi:hypothetical protein